MGLTSTHLVSTPVWSNKYPTSSGMQKFELKVRLPRDVKDWLVDQALQNASSQSSECVRAVRAHMARYLREDGIPCQKVKDV
jgi:hypothetical protein